jgi:hypothetical protein|nr:MAG TPA: hypothetical protein [Bacteriophage sp.]
MIKTSPGEVIVPGLFSCRKVPIKLNNNGSCQVTTDLTTIPSDINGQRFTAPFSIHHRRHIVNVSQIILMFFKH